MEMTEMNSRFNELKSMIVSARSFQSGPETNTAIKELDSVVYKFTCDTEKCNSQEAITLCLMMKDLLNQWGIVIKRRGRK
jgi:hypothetical protein